MGHRFIPNCECTDPEFHIAEEGQAIRCTDCGLPMAYEWWDGDEIPDSQNFAAGEEKKAPVATLPARGWKDSDETAFAKWYDTPEY